MDTEKLLSIQINFNQKLNKTDAVSWWKQVAEAEEKVGSDILWESNTAKNLFSPATLLVDAMWSSQFSGDNLRDSSDVFIPFLV